jgi:hypothetical protein
VLEDHPELTPVALQLLICEGETSQTGNVGDIDIDRHEGPEV